MYVQKHTHKNKQFSLLSEVRWKFEQDEQGQGPDSDWKFPTWILKVHTTLSKFSSFSDFPFFSDNMHDCLTKDHSKITDWAILFTYRLKSVEIMKV